MDNWKLRKGYKRVNELPQRYKKLCRVSGKIRWVSQKDAAKAVEGLGGTGSYYYCSYCQSWHLTRYPFPTQNVKSPPESRDFRAERNSFLKTKRRTTERLQYAIAAGELAWRWLEHLQHDEPEPDRPISDIRELLDRAEGPWRE